MSYGTIADDYYVKTVERHVKQLAYPAKLPGAQVRFLASRLIEEKSKFEERRKKAQLDLDRCSQHTFVDIKALPASARPTAKKLEKLLKEACSAKQTLTSAGIDPFYQVIDWASVKREYRVKASDAEYRVRREKLVAAVEAITVDARNAENELNALIKAVAQTHIDKMKQKLAKDLPALQAALDGDRQALKALPEVTVTSIEEQE